MATGVIKKKMEKGFGFITPSEGSTELFFHSSGCVTSFDSLQEGQTVSFEIESSDKGPRATQVTAA